MASLANNIIKEIDKHFKRIEVANDKAEVKALNRAGKSAYGATIKFLTGNYNISQKNLKKYFTTVNARKGKAVFTIKAQKKGLSLFINAGSTKLFGTRQLKKGLKFTVKKGSPQFIPSGFIQTMKSGHKGGFVRNPKEQSATRPGKLTKHSQAIKEFYGMNVGGVFSGKVTQKELEDQFFKRFKKEFEQAIKYEMQKL